jgi:hypothetical protein
VRSSLSPLALPFLPTSTSFGCRFSPSHLASVVAKVWLLCHDKPSGFLFSSFSMQQLLSNL